MDFENKVAIVTGAAQNLGKAIAAQLAQGGATVILVDRNGATLKETAEKLAEVSDKLDAFVCDVTEEEMVEDICRKTVEKYGKIDILINNAGIWRDDMTPFVETKSASWKEKINVNILGTMYFCHAALPYMIEKRAGRIVNIGSVAGHYGNANMAAYSMTKGAVTAFTRAIAKEVTPLGITVNCVAPGSVNTINDDPNYPTALSFSGRLGTCEEHANAVCFLASDKASYISGQEILVDGLRLKM